jgi:hypothetical protein
MKELPILEVEVGKPVKLDKGAAAFFMMGKDKLDWRNVKVYITRVKLDAKGKPIIIVHNNEVPEVITETVPEEEMKLITKFRVVGLVPE